MSSFDFLIASSLLLEHGEEKINVVDFVIAGRINWFTDKPRADGHHICLGTICTIDWWYSWEPLGYNLNPKCTSSRLHRAFSVVYWVKCAGGAATPDWLVWHRVVYWHLNGITAADSVMITEQGRSFCRAWIRFERRLITCKIIASIILVEVVHEKNENERGELKNTYELYIFLKPGFLEWATSSYYRRHLSTCISPAECGIGGT